MALENHLVIGVRDSTHFTLCFPYGVTFRSYVKLKIAVVPTGGRSSEYCGDDGVSCTEGELCADLRQ